MTPNSVVSIREISRAGGLLMATGLYFISCTKTPSHTGPSYTTQPAVYAGYDTTIYYSNYKDSASYTLHAELPANTLKVISYRWTMPGLHPGDIILIGTDPAIKISLKEGIYMFWVEAIFSNSAIRRDSVFVTVLGPFTHYKWKMTAAVSPTALDINGDGIASTDLFSQFETCYTDNLWHMYPRSGEYYANLEIDNMLTVCQNTKYDEFGGTMGFTLPDWNYPFNTIRMGAVTSKIDFPNDSSMTLEGAWIYPSYQYGDGIYAKYSFRRN